MTVTDARPAAGSPTPEAPTLFPGLTTSVPDACAPGLRVAHREGAVVHHGPSSAAPAAALDLLVETACELLDVDYAGVHLVADGIHRVVATSDTVAHAPMPRLDTLCGVLLARHVPEDSFDLVLGPQVIEVGDTAADPTLPVVSLTAEDAAPVRFYAAVPLTGADGRARGTLCVIAHHPRAFTDLERRTLLLLGVAASTLLAGCDGPQTG